MDVEQLAAADLARSGLTLDAAQEAGIYVCENAQEEVYEDFHPLPALVLTYATAEGHDVTFEREGETLPFCRVRYLVSPPAKRGFVKEKVRRYDQPKNSGVWAYFPQTDQFRWSEIAADPEIPICITEGEKKALAACLAGVPTIGLGGVYNFIRDDRLLPELASFEYEDRNIFIV